MQETVRADFGLTVGVSRSSLEGESGDVTFRAIGQKSVRLGFS